MEKSNKTICWPKKNGYSLFEYIREICTKFISPLWKILEPVEAQPKRGGKSVALSSIRNASVSSSSTVISEIYSDVLQLVSTKSKRNGKWGKNVQPCLIETTKNLLFFPPADVGHIEESPKKGFSIISRTARTIISPVMKKSWTIP